MIKRILIITLSILIVSFVTVFSFGQSKKYGKLPNGERLEKIKQSKYYSKNEFKNLNFTSVMTDDVNYLKLIKNFIFANTKPQKTLPSSKINLLELDCDSNSIVWFGHSSYFMQIDGKTILVDPVLCGTASPFSFTVKAFKGTDIYSPEDIPEIDYLFITHDHWDHLDFETIMRLKSKIKKVVCGLGVGAHFEYWGFDKSKIVEMEWRDSCKFEDEFLVNCMPARHFSGRWLKSNQTLWASFVIRTPTIQIFIGGDSGYDVHFSEIGKTFGEFDLVILENGQYDNDWRYIHMLPVEVLQAAKDLNAKKMFPVHSSKFALSIHSWNAPLQSISALNEKVNLSIMTPKIGEVVYLKDNKQMFSKWWENIEN